MQFPLDPRGLRYLPTTPINFSEMRAFALAQKQVEVLSIAKSITTSARSIELRSAETHLHAITVIELSTAYSGFYVFHQEGMSLLSVIGNRFACFFVGEEAPNKFTHHLNHQTGMGPAIESPQDTDEPFIELISAVFDGL